MLRLAKRLFRRGGDDMAAPSIDAKAATPSAMPDTASKDSSAATTALVCDLLIGNNLLQGYLGGADALRLEVVSKRSPFGKEALRKRTLLRFPSSDEGFSYKWWQSPLRHILDRYPNIRIIDAEISTMDCIGDDNRRFLHVLMIELAGASLPHLRELRVPEAYLSVERYMVCQEYPHLVVTPALDSSVEQFLAAGYACGNREEYPWRIHRCHQFLEPNDWYIFSAPGTEGYSAKLVNYELRGGIIYYEAVIRTPDKDIRVTWGDANSPLNGDIEALVDTWHDEIYEAFGPGVPSYELEPPGLIYDIVADLLNNMDWEREAWLAFERSCREDYEERERESFQRGAFDMLLYYMADFYANDVRITIMARRG